MSCSCGHCNIDRQSGLAALRHHGPSPSVMAAERAGLNCVHGSCIPLRGLHRLPTEFVLVRTPAFSALRCNIPARRPQNNIKQTHTMARSSVDLLTLLDHAWWVAPAALADAMVATTLRLSRRPRRQH